MDAATDVRDILDIGGNGRGTEETAGLLKDAFMGSADKKALKKANKKLDAKRPEGMARELWGLLWTDNTDLPPLVPSDTAQGYKQAKARIGSSKVRSWKWMAFTNPARKDGAIFYHWRRAADEGKDYPFATFNKSVDVSQYSDLEYSQHLHNENWTRAETDHLFELCRRFDLRFIVINDRWNRDLYQERSTEDLKDRYYFVSNMLAKVRAAPGHEPRLRAFDAEHERKRKEQLIKLFNRTEEEVEEEEQLLSDLKKIELRKKERERKANDLQKLISAADTSAGTASAGGAAGLSAAARKGLAAAGGGGAQHVDGRKFPRKRFHHLVKSRDGGAGSGGGGGSGAAAASHDVGSAAPVSAGPIKFPDGKQGGVALRSQRMKLPAAIGLKKTKAIEQVLEELNIDLNPMPTEEIVQHFNDLRQDIVLLYELKLALASCQYELQTLKLRLETLAPERKIELPFLSTHSGDKEEEDTGGERRISESIDFLASNPFRKRKAALENTNLIKKMKMKI